MIIKKCKGVEETLEGKINSKEKNNQQIRSVIELCNLYVRGEQGPWIGA